MNLYIEIDSSGNPINHPFFEENLIQAFGKVPEGWEVFIRTEPPSASIYQIIEIGAYQKIDGVWTDNWVLRDMTEDEKSAKKQFFKDKFNALPNIFNFSAWTLDEATCTMQPPIPRPEHDQTKLDAGIRTFWCGAENNWKDTPPRPEGDYKFDFLAWDWVAI